LRMLLNSFPNSKRKRCIAISTVKTNPITGF